MVGAIGILIGRRKKKTPGIHEGLPLFHTHISGLGKSWACKHRKTKSQKTMTHINIKQTSSEFAGKIFIVLGTPYGLYVKNKLLDSANICK
jgi:hypothetical protein